MLKPTLELSNFTFTELFHHKGLERLDHEFLTALYDHAPALHESLLAYRQADAIFIPETTSELLIACATFLDSFLAKLFNIEEAAALVQAQTLAQNPVAAFKKFFVLRRAKKTLIKYREFA